MIAFIGDSTTAALYSPPGFPAIVGTALHVRFHNLALKYPPSYNMQQALDEELPNLPSDTSEAVLFLGTNDLRGLALGDEKIADVEAANAKILSSLHARHIRIFELTIRDYTKEPSWQAQAYDVSSRDKVGEYVDALNRFYRTTTGVTIIDAADWDDVYTAGWTTDGVHFTDASMRRFANHLARALTR